ncbi:MAG TPA: Rieske 2Fe-2S domain-containing protein [Solirubrobacteraceae bacterium]|nr:Rieske 2Fe-2S domain-containing protein [Solirubrobacteraceae bacterium]
MSDLDMTSRYLSPMEPLVSGIESAEILDQPATLLARAVRGVLSPGKLKDGLSGTWLGHAVHPMLTDVVIGSFLSASALDLVAGEDGQPASERLIMIGMAAYGPTAAAGASDWIDGEFDDRVKRVGIVHASGNLTALTLYTASLIARRRGAQTRGKLLAAAGASVLLVGGYLGGHLSLRRGIGVDETVFDPGSDDWRPAADAAQLPEGQPTRVVVDETPVLLLKAGERIYAIHDRCSHRGCSLVDGNVEGHEIVCSCHFSRFDLRDGSVIRGPATAPQPTFQVRESDGVLEVRRVG